MVNEELNNKVNQLKQRYEAHFNRPFPDRIIGWWEPRYANEPGVLEAGVKVMQTDVEKAIRTNTPIEEMTEEEWQRIIF
jgi:hypothetical protein